MSRGATPAIDLVTRAGVGHRLHAYVPGERQGRERATRPEYGLEAAAALGIEPGRIGKTLIASVDGRLVAAVVPVDRQLDPKRLAAAVGGRSCELTDTATAERAAGSVIGAISPLGLRRPLPLVVDASLLAHPTILVSAGRRGLQLELAPRDLVRLGTANPADIAR